MTKQLNDKEFNLIRKHLKENFGINLNDEKKSLVYSRLNNVLKELEMESFSDYYSYLKSDTSGKANKIFIDKMTTNHTFFMREFNHFLFFRDKVLPILEEKNKDVKDIRIWSAGCSSGEEAYTLQFIIQDYFGADNEWDTDIFATDISNSILSKAFKGIYSDKELIEVPDIWLHKYFDKIDEENMQVKEFIRNKIVFRKRNLFDKNYNFRKKMQVIFCRNVMIYFDTENKKNLVNNLYENTENGGYIFIGHSESLTNLNKNYKYVAPAIYQK